ncbi:alpha/beta fold hydrolase [Arenimonas oryziterrae]|uniref:Proline iminopeptidase n=1 Tax=Arenimonas oryziterrae DSM 21050 = YC6267 TaxID=1121015 RepID=A0A091AXI1_9GAMM|nr:alpha/beta hydrolase [Arenimonas oryziterrae]KFN44166.1 hypothetical protein N789_07045 [Arenimonas oryziterrae DSM 21050 = YC6267]
MTRLPLAALLWLLPFCAFADFAPAPPPPNLNLAPCRTATAAVHEQGFVMIGGIEQWVTIQGASCANPVVLFVHGGPGNPLTPFADAVYGAWEKDFTLVQWDQRGAGRTFGRHPQAADATLTIEQMAQDGVEVAAYVTQRLGKQKVLLLGGSWGSILGVHMIKARPALFTAYVGAGQLVSYRDNPLASYQKTLALARAANDAKTLETLEALGPPPWTNPRAFGVLRRATRLYEAKKSTPAPADWWTLPAEYATAERQAEYEAGEDYSYLQFVGLTGEGMLSKLNLPKLGLKFDVPVFIIEGEEDLVSTPEVAKAYFDAISAPRKEFVLLPKAGHDPNAATIAAEYRLLRSVATPE